LVFTRHLGEADPGGGGGGPPPPQSSIVVLSRDCFRWRGFHGNETIRLIFVVAVEMGRIKGYDKEWKYECVGEELDACEEGEDICGWGFDGVLLLLGLSGVK
jgi:hypothetical protein